MITAVAILTLFAQSVVETYNAAAADMQARRWAEAAQKYEEVLKDDPTHIPTMFNLAVCYSNLRNSERAVELYTKLLEQDGTVFEARVNLALLLQKLQKLDA